MACRILFLVALCLVLFTACTAAEESRSPDALPENVQPTAVPPTSEPAATEMPPTLEPTATFPPPTPEQAEVAVVEDVLYVTAVESDAQDQLLNIYYTPGTAGKKPVVIWSHGTNGDRTAGRTFGRILAKEGFVVLSIDWRDNIAGSRMTPHLREAMENAECALRFAASQAGQYGADPEQVIWTGYSAGAWLGSMIAFGEGDLAAEWDGYAAANDGPAQRVECVENSDAAEIVTYVSSAGPFPGDFWFGNGDNPTWTKVFAPMHSYSAVGHNPELSVRIFHGERDRGIDTHFDDAEAFAEALKEAGYDVEFHPQPGGHESFAVEVVAEIGAMYGD